VTTDILSVEDVLDGKPPPNASTTQRP
jgi:hypothetical protein